MTTTKRTTLNRIGVTLAIAMAVSAQLAAAAPRSAYAEGNGTKPVVARPVSGLGDKLGDKLTDKDNGPKSDIPIKPKLPDVPITPEDKKPPIKLAFPDLTVENLAVTMNGGNGQCDPDQTTVVAEIKNAGNGASGGFAVRLSVGGDDLPGGMQDVATIPAGGFRFVAFNGLALPQGQHSLKAIADPNQETADNKRDNNDKSAGFNCQSVPAAQADVEVTSFVVEGKHADDVSDCDPGKNSIYAVVRNKGGAAAGPFAVRMLADGEEPNDGTETVGGLDAGQETVVTFQKVKLNDGSHTLKVIADADYALDDADMGNNYQETSVSCAKE